MIEETVSIEAESGVHARPAAMFVKLANKFKSEIHVSKGDTRVNGKSIMGLMMLAITRGTVITIEAEGDDEKKAVSTLVKLIKENFERDDLL